MTYLKKAIEKFKHIFSVILKMDERFDEIKLNQGVIISLLNERKKQILIF